MDERDSTPPPDLAGKYTVHECLGEGAYGNVYRALDRTSGSYVALKVLHMRHMQATPDRTRFEREAPVLQQFNHQHIVQVLDYGYADDRPYIAFELLRGRPLNREIKRVGFMSDSRAGNIVRQVLIALSAAHSRGIIHRDIKPSNVFLLDTEPTPDFVKVLDFGVAKVTTGLLKPSESLTDTGEMVGTLQYMAPEQVRAETITPISDVYSTGLLLCELLSGDKVIKASGMIDALMKHTDPAEHILPASVMNTHLRSVVARAIRKKPSERYASCADMLRDVDSVLRLVGPPTTASGTLLLPEHLSADEGSASTQDLTDLLSVADE